jgi:hypothetical protein
MTRQRHGSQTASPKINRNVTEGRYGIAVDRDIKLGSNFGYRWDITNHAGLIVYPHQTN